MKVYGKEPKEITISGVIAITINNFVNKTIWIVLQFSFYIT